MTNEERYNDSLKKRASKRRLRAKALRSQGMTWEEVGRRLRVSKQRAHQIAKAADK